MTLNGVPMECVTNVKYFFMFTPDSKDDDELDMQKQLRTFYARSNTILSQFAKFDESLKLELFRSFVLVILKLRVAYNNAHRKILKLHMSCSESQMYVDSGVSRISFRGGGGGGSKFF